MKIALVIILMHLIYGWIYEKCVTDAGFDDGIPKWKLRIFWIYYLVDGLIP
jgi:hypothetical protein